MEVLKEVERQYEVLKREVCKREERMWDDEQHVELQEQLKGLREMEMAQPSREEEVRKLREEMGILRGRLDAVS